MTTYSASSCFSGECGLCHECCSNFSEKPKRKGLVKDQLTEDLSKFFPSEEIYNQSLAHNKRLNAWSKQMEYKSPMDTGKAPKSVNYYGETFKIVKGKLHDYVCDDPMCRLIHYSLHDSIKKKTYPKFPIYLRKDEKCKLCALCVEV